jgi:5-methylcytosine-specific restriction endonuclease McrBC regulatory subunit McrC
VREQNLAMVTWGKVRHDSIEVEIRSRVIEMEIDLVPEKAEELQRSKKEERRKEQRVRESWKGLDEISDCNNGQQNVGVLLLPRHCSHLTSVQVYTLLILTDILKHSTNTDLLFAFVFFSLKYCF